MTERLQMPMQRRLRGLRMHRVPENESDPSANPRAVWLLRLRERAVEEARGRAELSATLTNLQHTLATLPQIVQQNLQDVAGLAAEIGLRVAEEVVGEALERGLVDPTPTVKRCLEEATMGLADPELEVRLHPEDLSLVVTELDRDPAMRQCVERTHFTPDGSMPRAAVRVDTSAGHLVYDHREVLARMSEEVRKAVAAESGVTDGLP